MRICKIWDSEYPWDVRVEKVSRALSAAGHEVHLVARNRRAEPILETTPGLTIHRLASWKWAGRLGNASMFPAFFNPRWLNAITATARDTRADLLLCRDLPLAPTAVWAGRRLGRRVVLDMAENYPAMTQSLWDAGVQKRWDWLVRNPRMVSAVERWVLRHIDHVLVVVEESRDRLIGLGVPEERITIVGNTPALDRLRAVPPKVHRDGAPLRLIYLGLLEAPRGLEVVLRGLAACRQNGMAVELAIIGEGRERTAFEALSAELRLDSSVVQFRGFVPYDSAVIALQQADIGLVPHLANPSWNTTIPNKLFDYMAAGLAVITSDAKPAARVVRETGAGEVYPDRDPEALAAAVARLADVAHRARCGAQGREAVARRYNWENDSARLVAAIELINQG